MTNNDGGLREEAGFLPEKGDELEGTAVLRRQPQDELDGTAVLRREKQGGLVQAARLRREPGKPAHAAPVERQEEPEQDAPAAEEKQDELDGQQEGATQAADASQPEQEEAAQATQSQQKEEAPAASALPGQPSKVAPAALTNPKADIAALNKLERHLFAHRYAQTGIQSYASTIDPEMATEDRGEALAILAEEDQALLCSNETGELLERLGSVEAQALLTPTQQEQIRILRRDRARLVDVPPEIMSAYTKLTCEAQTVWERAKQAGDWQAFEPYLDKIVGLLRDIARLRDPGADPYDLWLGEFEHGSNRSFYDGLFDEIKAVVVPLLAEIRASKRQPTDSFFDGRFDERRQWELAKNLIQVEGLDEKKLLLLSSEHPFSDALTSNYAIIATHVYENDVLSNVFSVLHEGGHALYEMGVAKEFDRTSLKGGTSMGMHEAQSRFFENYIGRSQSFAPRLLKLMAQSFPGQLGRVTPRQLYAAINRVESGPIRVEADELSYPLHILVRYEIEQQLISGEATAKDVPALWRSLYHKYLGVKVDNDREGALQDVHWSCGSFGYFPTYALGSAIGAQLRARMLKEDMDWESLLKAGDLGPIREWLGARIWRFGRSRDTAELIQSACNEPFSAHYYSEYLKEKFTALYGL